jgi:hypothetical protein
MVRYSFLVRLSHPPLHADLSRRILDHFIRSIQQRLRNGETDLLRRFQIDHQFELRGLLDRQIGGLGSLQGTCPSRELIEELLSVVVKDDGRANLRGKSRATSVAIAVKIKHTSGLESIYPGLLKRRA